MPVHKETNVTWWRADYLRTSPRSQDSCSTGLEEHQQGSCCSDDGCESQTSACHCYCVVTAITYDICSINFRVATQFMCIGNQIMWMSSWDFMCQCSCIFPMNIVVRLTHWFHSTCSDILHNQDIQPTVNQGDEEGKVTPQLRVIARWLNYLKLTLRGNSELDQRIRSFLYLLQLMDNSPLMITGHLQDEIRPVWNYVLHILREQSIRCLSCCYYHDTNSIRFFFIYTIHYIKCKDNIDL